MKRDPRLHGLTSDHHQGLVLARKIASGKAGAEEVRRVFEAELEPHFRLEEELLLPALRHAGDHALVERTLADHVAMRRLVAAARASEGMLAFGAALEAHIRFEERELFPAAEAHLSAEVLEQIASRAPHPRR